MDQYHVRLIPSGRCGKALINTYVSDPLRAVRRGVCCCSVRLRPSLAACLSIDSRPLCAFIRRCQSVHCPAAALLKCADELTPSRQIRTCYLKSGPRSLINHSAPLSVSPWICLSVSVSVSLSRCVIWTSILTPES